MLAISVFIYKYILLQVNTYIYIYIYIKQNSGNKFEMGTKIDHGKRI